VMAWMMDTISMEAGYSIPAVVTGKPLEIGGSEGRRSATGRGVTIVAIEICRRLQRNPMETTVAVQGFGNVGSVSAELMEERGFRVCAVSDVSGGIYNPAGLEVQAVLRHRDRTGGVAGFPGAAPVSNADLLELPVDVLVPAALENQITARNAGRIQASVIIEGANGPTTPDADLILEQRGIVVVPDILANAGGVVVSYLEWVQNMQAYSWSERDVARRLEDVMATAYDAVTSLAIERGISLRRAAHALGVGRVAEAHELRGLYP
jgi:glutamate dehydrogenase (NAD(P)+)